MKNKRPHKLNYTNHGDGPPVILVHGVAGSLHQWDYLIPTLAGAGYRALAVDLIGHGDSPRLNGSTNSIESVYEYFKVWLETLNLVEPPIIISHSMGGYIALMHALNGFEVRGLVLTSPYYTPQQLTGPVRLSVRRPKLSMKLLQKTPTLLVESAMVISDRSGLTLPSEARRQMAIDFKRFDPHLIALPHTTENLLPFLDQISTPTMIIWGDNDLTLSPASFLDLVQAIPQAKAFALPGCGHVPHLTRLDFFNETVINFLSEVHPA